MYDIRNPFIVIGLVLSVCISVAIAYETNSFEAGFRILLLYLGFLVAFWMFVYVTDEYTKGIVLLVSFSYLLYILVISVAGVIYAVNSKKGGEVYVSEKIDPEEITWFILLMLVAVSTVAFFTKFPMMSLSPVILLLIERKRKLYFSFQIRKNGFLSMGRYMPFEQIQLVSWAHQLRKGKLKIALRTGKTCIVKVPWKLILPVDDYVRKYQRPT